jgi:hypothetical protein
MNQPVDKIIELESLQSLDRLVQNCTRSERRDVLNHFLTQGYREIACRMNPDNPARGQRSIYEALDFLDAENPGLGYSIQRNIIVRQGEQYLEPMIPACNKKRQKTKSSHE